MNVAMTQGLQPPPTRGLSHGPLHRSIVIYMDDLLCYSPSLEQHLQDVREVLAILRQDKLYVKASKCEFGPREFGFLGLGGRCGS